MQKYKVACVEMGRVALQAFVDFLCEDDTLAPLLQGVKGVDEALLGQWHTFMSSATLNTDKVKYAKALQRMMNTNVTLYHVCEYHDFPGLLAALETQGISHHAEACYVNSSIEQKKVFWNYVTTINAHVRAANSLPVLVVPARSEIQANIQEARRKRRSAQAGHEPAPGASPEAQIPQDPALAEFLRGLFHDAPTPDSLLALDDAACEEIARDFRAFLSSLLPQEDECASGGRKVVDAYAAQEQAVFELEWPPSLEDVRKLFRSRCQQGRDQQVWGECSQLRTLCELKSCLPSGMMRQIEQKAAAAAHSLSTGGDIDFSKLDLQSISKDVVESCSPEDLKSMAANLDSLLPVLTTAAAGLGQAAGGDPIGAAGMPDMAMLAKMTGMLDGKH